MKSGEIDFRSRLASAWRGVLHAGGLAWDAAGPVSRGFREAARHPQAPLAVMSALVFLAISIAGIKADEYVAATIRSVSTDTGWAGIWSGWLVFPLAWGAILLALLEPGRPPYPPRIWMAALGVTLVAAVRLWMSWDGPLTHLAIRDLSDVFGFGLCAIALGVLCRKSPAAAHGVWFAALAFMLVGRWPISQGTLLLRPDLLPILICLWWTALAAGPLSRDRNAPAKRSGLRRLERGLSATLRRHAPALAPWGSILPAHVLALAAGGSLALMAQSLTRPSGAGWIEAVRQMELLWTRSALFGWGRTRLLRMTAAGIEPRELEAPGWLGSAGLFGSLGLVGVIALVVSVLALIWAGAAWRGSLGLRRRSAPQAAFQAASALLGVILAGGPNSSVPALLCLGWLGLAFGGSEARRFARQRGEPVTLSAVARSMRWTGAIVALVILGVGGLLAAGPVWSRAVLAGIKAKDLDDPELRFRIFRARTLDPWNPRGELAYAAYLRAELTRSPQWNEDLYRRICATYRAAMALDPYDPVIALRLADVQNSAKRIDDALRTAQRALLTTPASQELLEWIFIRATAEERLAIAQSAVRRALAIHPESTRWWLRRYSLDQKTGRGPQAGDALKVALTALSGDPKAPGEGEMIAAAFLRRGIVEIESKKEAAKKR